MRKKPQAVPRLDVSAAERATDSDETHTDFESDSDGSTMLGSDKDDDGRRNTVWLLDMQREAALLGFPKSKQQRKHRYSLGLKRFGRRWSSGWSSTTSIMPSAGVKKKKGKKGHKVKSVAAELGAVITVPAINANEFLAAGIAEVRIHSHAHTLHPYCVTLAHSFMVDFADAQVAARHRRGGGDPTNLRPRASQHHVYRRAQDGVVRGR